MISKTKQTETIKSVLTALLNTYDEEQALNIFEILMKLIKRK